MGSQRFQRLENADVRTQRLLRAGTRTKDPAASDTLYVHGLAAPFTVERMPDGTLKSNVSAQAQVQALGFGKTEDEVRAEGTAQDVAPHRVMEGNRPTNVLLAEVLTPYRLGTLVALYEHSAFTQGTIWGIDSFDQWGVELGKVLAVAITPELESATEPALGHDSSTNALIRHYRTLKV
jgi:glucose-6-phosphate isomerase